MRKTYTAISLYISKNAAPQSRQSTMHRKKAPQSRQSTMIFSPVVGIGTHPLTRRRVCPLPFGSRGGGTFAGGKGGGGGGSNSDEGTVTVAP
jgi:hypothetical protein